MLDFNAARRRRIDRLLDAVGVGPGTRLLEVGSDGGELAIRAARRGAIVHSVTSSAVLREAAVRKVVAAGMAGRVHVRLSDLGEIRRPLGGFDAIVGVALPSAGTLARLLAPGGRARSATGGGLPYSSAHPADDR
ncbi:SAM-dependent methyltransferase [Dactylosporangium sp. CS-033363]|uniref:SAM-dependent methyltransferase n=1 Tax=Dactylosporangium sp. CS-033363 TaxID=3239935 RepID=UPI003D8F4AA9